MGSNTEKAEQQEAAGGNGKDTPAASRYGHSRHFTPVGHALWSAAAFVAHPLLGVLSWTVQVTTRVLGLAPKQPPPLTHGNHPSGLRELLPVPHDSKALTELLWVGVPADSSNLRQLFVIIPGNPGNTAFYEEYIEAIHENDATMACVVIGHLGHSALSGDGETAFNLEDQVAHKIHVLEHLQRKFPKATFVLAGHSVGAYMCVELMRTLPPSRVARVLCLFPTIHHIGSTPNAQRLYPVLSLFKKVASQAAFLLRHLPRAVLNLIINFQLKGATQRTRDAVHGLVHEYVAMNALTMGHHEMDEILAFDKAHLQGISEKLLFCFAQYDGWLTPVHEKELMECCPESTVVRCPEGVNHGFVTHTPEVVAEMTVRWLQEAFATN